MKKNYLYIRLAGICIKINCLDDTLYYYLNEEYVTVKNNKKKPELELTIDKTGDYYNFILNKPKLKYATETNVKFGMKYLDFVLMSMIAYGAASDDILLLHASSFKNGQKSFVYTGPTGAGKSTVIGKIRKSAIYSDDTAVIKKIGKSFYLYPSPFDKRKLAGKNYRPVKISKIFILVKNKSNFIQKASPPEKYKALATSDIYQFLKNYFSKSKKIHSAMQYNKIYGIILDIIANVDILKLNFNRKYVPEDNYP